MKGIRFFLPVIVLCSASLVSGQSEKTIVYRGSGGYSLVERTNLRRYDNGKYVGLMSREVRSFISPSSAPTKALANPKNPLSQGRWYDGSFYVMEETKRNMQSAASGIHDSIPSIFNISPEGRLTMYKDNGYPSFRSFPAFPSGALKPGDTWTGSAVRCVDPLNKGVFTRMGMEVLYTFAGEEVYKGMDVFRIHATWNNKYSLSEGDPRGDTSLVRSSGFHKAEIIVLKATGEAILVTDQVDEIFAYSDGKNINFKGTIILFTEFPPAVDTEKIMPALQRIASTEPAPATPSSAATSSSTAVSPVPSSVAQVPSPSHPQSQNPSHSVPQPKNNMLVEKTEAGLRLSVRNIRFESDSDKILASESARLDEIAEVLKLAPKNHFLIEGHTASVGRPEGEQTLSVERAHSIARELTKRGVSAGAFICRGWGGTRPVATNDTEEGRAQNRRVEITILE